MAIDQVAKSLWTPDGVVPLRERDVIPLTQQELVMLSRMHEWAFKHGISVVCKRCDHAITGQNNDSPSNRVAVVQCQCRQWRFDAR